MQNISIQDKLAISEALEDDINCEYEITHIDTDDTIQMFILDIPHPDIDFWEKNLSRQLIKKEKEIIHTYLLESDINSQIKSLHFNIWSHGAFSIPKLTKNNGNCLFESLSHLGFGKPSEIRKGIASLLHLVRDEIYFFPKTNIAPEELFLNCNDTEMVKDLRTGEVYEYDYDMMIMDLYTFSSWKRLPTELILMAICRVYEIELKIFSNKSKYVNTISVFDNLDIPTYYLGHINEKHYVPVIKLDDSITLNPMLSNEFASYYPIYSEGKKQYVQWVNAVLERTKPPVLQPEKKKITGINLNYEDYEDFSIDDFFIVK